MKNDEAQIISIQNKLKNAICEISISDNNKGLGCLVSLPILIENKNHCGILTSNSVLSKTELKVNNVIKLNFKESHKVYDYSIQDKCLLFTCPFLGVSFMEIPDGFIKDIECLEIQENPKEKQIILASQINQEGEIVLCQGNSLSFFGTHILYNINDSYKENAIGTPIISLFGDSLGKIIGINQSDTLNGENNDQYSVINIDIVMRAIKGLVYKNKIKPSETLSDAKKLSLTEIHILKKEGLKETDNSNVFISPASHGITPLWFYRTHYAWFWTPTEPKNLSMEEILKCNWSLIQDKYPIKVFGGSWNNIPPAERNITLIKHLINSGLKFLLD